MIHFHAPIGVLFFYFDTVKTDNSGGRDDDNQVISKQHTPTATSLCTTTAATTNSTQQQLYNSTTSRKTSLVPATKIAQKGKILKIKGTDHFFETLSVGTDHSYLIFTGFFSQN